MLIPNFGELHKIKTDKGYNKLSPEIKTICKNLGINLLDLTVDINSPYFTQKINLPCDGHWSKTGNEIVAKMVKTKLEEWKYLPE
jgi:hypothetical protein